MKKNIFLLLLVLAISAFRVNCQTSLHSKMYKAALKCIVDSIHFSEGEYYVSDSIYDISVLNSYTPENIESFPIEKEILNRLLDFDRLYVKCDIHKPQYSLFLKTLNKGIDSTKTQFAIYFSYIEETVLYAQVLKIHRERALSLSNYDINNFHTVCRFNESKFFRFFFNEDGSFKHIYTAKIVFD